MPERVIPESNPEKSTIFLRIASLNVLSYGDYGDMSSRANDYSTDSLDLPLFVAVETVAEHAIRMFVDWPRLVGLEPLMAAARTAWRSAWAVQDALRSCLGWVRPRPWQQGLGRGNEVAARWPDPPASAMLARVMEKRLNCPPTFSAGRLFDAACALLSVHPVAKFEGHVPMALEQRATE